MQTAAAPEVLRRPAVLLRKPWTVAAGCFCAALAYAVVRYHHFGGTPWSGLPLFVMNKAVSFAAVLLFAATHAFRPAPPAGVKLGLAALWLAGLHVLMSAALMSPAVYPKLYEGGALNFAGQLSMLCGCLAVMLLALPGVASLPGLWNTLTPVQRQAARRAGHAALCAAALHVFAMGKAGWMRPGTWPGGMPPITLLSFAVLAAALAVKLRPRRP